MTDRVNGGGHSHSTKIKDNINFRNVKTFNSPKEAICLEIFMNNEWIQIGSIYIPPNVKINNKSHKFSQSDLHKVFYHPSKAIWGCDYNARSVEWGDSSENVYGKLICEFIKNSDINAQAPDSPTCFRSSEGSFIDFFLTKECNIKCTSFP